MENLKTINYYTEKKGVSPIIRDSVKAQALNHANIDLSSFEKCGDYMVTPIAIDKVTGETLYLKINATVGTLPKTSEKKKVSKSTEPIEVPTLF